MCCSICRFAANCHNDCMDIYFLNSVLVMNDGVFCLNIIHIFRFFLHVISLGTDKESPGSVGMRTNPQDSGWSSVIEKSEEIAIDDDEDSEPDEELDLEVNCQSAPEASVRFVTIFYF